MHRPGVRCHSLISTGRDFVFPLHRVVIFFNVLILSFFRELFSDSSLFVQFFFSSLLFYITLCRMAAVTGNAGEAVFDPDDDQLGTLPPGTLVLCFFPPNPYWVARVMGYKEARAQRGLLDRRGTLERLRKGDEHGVAVYFFGEPTVAILPVDLVEPHACVQGPHAGAFRHWIWSASLSEQVARDWPPFSLDIRIRWNKAFDSANIYAKRCVLATKAYGHLTSPPVPIYPCMRDPPQFLVIEGCEYQNGAVRNGHLPVGSMIWCCVENEPIWPCRVVALRHPHYMTLRAQALRDGYAVTEKTEPVLFFGEDSMTPPPPPVLASLSDCAVLIPGEDKQWIPHYKLRSQKVAADRKWDVQWDEEIWTAWEVACEIACDCARAGSIRPVIEWMQVPKASDGPGNALNQQSGMRNLDIHPGNSTPITADYPSSSSGSSSGSARPDAHNSDLKRDLSADDNGDAKLRMSCTDVKESKTYRTGGKKCKPVESVPVTCTNEVHFTLGTLMEGDKSFGIDLNLDKHMEHLASHDGTCLDLEVFADNSEPYKFSESDLATFENLAGVKDDLDGVWDDDDIGGENDCVAELVIDNVKGNDCYSDTADRRAQTDIEEIREAARRINASLSKRNKQGKPHKKSRSVQTPTRSSTPHRKLNLEPDTNDSRNQGTVVSASAPDKTYCKSENTVQTEKQNSNRSVPSLSVSMSPRLQAGVAKTSDKTKSSSNSKKSSTSSLLLSGLRRKPAAADAASAVQSPSECPSKSFPAGGASASRATNKNCNTVAQQHSTGIADIYDEWY